MNTQDKEIRKDTQKASNDEAQGKIQKEVLFFLLKLAQFSILCSSWHYRITSLSLAEGMTK